MHRFNYTVKITDTYQWELEINPSGLFYKDVSGLYNQSPDRITSQEISDFWTYGPLLPVPDPDIRKRLLDIIRKDYHPGSEAHFPLLEYPVYAIPPMWTSGDFRASDFVIMRDYGLEYGRENFHDGLVHLGFVSFEYCLTKPEFAQQRLGYAVWEDAISRMPDRGDVRLPVKTVILPHPSVEKAELQRRIAALDDPGQPDAERALIEWAGSAVALNRFDAAQALWERNRGEESVSLLLSLLEEEDPEHYWRNIVFNILYKRYSSRTVRNRIIQCLEGEREDYFKKAVDALRMWSLFENTKLAEPGLLQALSWENKVQGAAGFREAVKKVDLLIC